MRVQLTIELLHSLFYLKGYNMRAFLPAHDKELGTDIILATTLLDRLRGLLGRKSLPAGQGLLLRPCNGIHTFFMKFPIDVVFLDKENQVIVFYKNLQPNRLTSIYKTVHSVLELPAGTLDNKTAIGDKIEFS